MSKAQGWTAGPWEWRGWNYGGAHFWDKDGLAGYLVGADDRVILSATTTEGEDPRVEVESEAYARLIEAAPALYEALEKLVKELDGAYCGAGVHVGLGWARAALAKATIRAEGDGGGK